MTILLSQIWGNEPRNITCKNYVLDCIDLVENIVQDGIEKGEIVNGDSKLIATEIFGIISSSLVYSLKTGNPLETKQIYLQYEKTLLRGLKK